MTDNELIAEFMGWVRYEANALYNLPQWYDPDLKDLRKKGKFKGYTEQLDFHRKWDWLMPVVEKIKDLGFDVNFSLNSSNVPSSAAACWIVSVPEGFVNPSIIEDNLLKAVYKAIVYFIKWYNDQPK